MPAQPTTLSPAPPSPAPLTAQSPGLPRQRIASIDALRGLTFFTMLFVNALSGAEGVPAGLQHLPASADGMSLADVVFPAFLYVVGMSIPFGLDRQAAGQGAWTALRRAALRAFGLIVLGLFMVNAEESDGASMAIPIHLWILVFYGAAFLVWGAWRFANPWHARLLRGAGVAIIVVLALLYRGQDGGWMNTSWWGILGCIGWAYLAASAVYLCCRGQGPRTLAALAAATAGCVLWFMASRACNGNGVIAMHATHASLVLCGMACVLLFFGAGTGGQGLRTVAAGAALAALLAACAWLLHRWYPISKIGATPPWALYCAALCTALYTLLYWLVELRGAVRWTALVEPAATNPLVTYLLPMILVSLMHLLGLRWWPALMQGAGAIAFSLLFAAATLVVVAFLNRYHVRLKL
ncbi:DUF5009 domain-containing protein [Pseudoduganella sp. SL102]|uniref:DUF5009 domain-containing protein n=1 Tax=Pseudoduganella sp. SL102 TaxID=2995154 RepID=UPI00248AD8AD|nr:DUF5009 domain-containing protein [Pseudoduganella sp. SL102]WBS05222.1 DUF5009 domain-containing protein [Pseudoduganella sp. SL102]